MNLLAASHWIALSVSKQPGMTRRRVGYCPQFDAHFANMTAGEHVELYATIKGIPRAMVKEAAAAKLAEVGLSPKDSDRLAANYSGGMKRRSSLGMATKGDPQIVFDVDPVARREIWELISEMVVGRGVLSPEERTSVILTTHSMEECEALCPRIGIMPTAATTTRLMCKRDGMSTNTHSKSGCNSNGVEETGSPQEFVGYAEQPILMEMSPWRR